MTQTIIDGKYIKNESDSHKTLAVQCEVTEFYGYNLDALWDLFAYGVKRPVCLIWYHSEISRSSMGSAFYQIAHVLQRVKEQDARMNWVDCFDYVLK